VEILVRLIGAQVQPQFGALPDRPAEREHAATLSQTAARLGWQPRTRLEDGLRRTVEWYQKDLVSSESGAIRKG
jgi:nucleoside-diphosphate-sugar epimerase